MINFCKILYGSAGNSTYLMQVVACLNFIVLSCTSTTTSHTMPTQMTLDQAIRLTQAWANSVNESFDQATISPNGDFRGLFAGAEIAYVAQTKTLLVEGLVIHKASLFVKDRELFDEIKRAGDREPYTRGEGYFFIEPKPLGYTEPQLTLRKDFTDGSMDGKQFVREVSWLLEWSTHWRMVRYPQVFEQTEEQMIREAPLIEKRAKEKRPRPW